MTARGSSRYLEDEEIADKQREVRLISFLFIPQRILQVALHPSTPPLQPRLFIPYLF